MVLYQQVKPTPVQNHLQKQPKGHNNICEKMSRASDGQMVVMHMGLIAQKEDGTPCLHTPQVDLASVLVLYQKSMTLAEKEGKAAG